MVHTVPSHVTHRDQQRLDELENRLRGFSTTDFTTVLHDDSDNIADNETTVDFLSSSLSDEDKLQVGVVLFVFILLVFCLVNKYSVGCFRNLTDWKISNKTLINLRVNGLDSVKHLNLYIICNKNIFVQSLMLLYALRMKSSAYVIISSKSK